MTISFLSPAIHGDLCESNAVEVNPADGVKRPNASADEGKLPALSGKLARGTSAAILDRIEELQHVKLHVLTSIRSHIAQAIYLYIPRADCRRGNSRPAPRCSAATSETRTIARKTSRPN